MRAKKILTVLILALLFITTAYSQDCSDGPGLPGDDPDTAQPCDVPLDTWVYGLVFVAAAGAAYQLHQKKKQLSV